MLLVNLMVNLLYRKYGVPLHNFFENWTRGISYLNNIKKDKNCSRFAHLARIGYTIIFA